MGDNMDISGNKIVTLTTWEVRTSSGSLFVHHTKMGVQQDITILERYGVSYDVSEVVVTSSMDDFGFTNE